MKECSLDCGLNGICIEDKCRCKSGWVIYILNINIIINNKYK
jgi:hypothetical protein